MFGASYHRWPVKLLRLHRPEKMCPKLSKKVHPRRHCDGAALGRTNRRLRAAGFLSTTTVGTHRFRRRRGLAHQTILQRPSPLARDVALLSTLMNGDVAFRALDLPGASRFTLHVLAAVAENSDISERTKAALQAAKARGTKLGNPKNLTDVARRRSLAVRRSQAAERHRLVLPLVTAWDQLEWSIQRMADTLTELRVPLPRPPQAGQAPKPWQFVQVRRLVAL
jgi:hypothetical protein